MLLVRPSWMDSFWNMRNYADSISASSGKFYVNQLGDKVKGLSALKFWNKAFVVLQLLNFFWKQIFVCQLLNFSGKRSISATYRWNKINVSQLLKLFLEQDLFSEQEIWLVALKYFLEQELWLAALKYFRNKKYGW